MKDYIKIISALLAKAASTEHPGERQSFLDKADELSLRHKIDLSQVDPTNTVKREGIQTVEWPVELPEEFYSQVNQVFAAVVYHCSLRYRWKNWRTAQVVGFESDIAMAELLWPLVYRELAGNLFPSWDKGLDFDSNVYNHVKGGHKWQMIYQTAVNAGVEGLSWPSGRFKAAYNRACKARGEEPTAHTQRHSAFRASYANAFHRTIASRLAKQRQRSEGKIDDKAGMALALRSTEERVDEEFYRLFPEYDPEVQRLRSEAFRAAEKARRAALTDEERAREDKEAEAAERRARRNYGRVRESNDYDSNGWAHGTKVANNVDLSMGRNHITPNRTEIH